MYGSVLLIWIHVFMWTQKVDIKWRQTSMQMKKECILQKTWYKKWAHLAEIPADGWAGAANNTEHKQIPTTEK